MGAPLLIPTRNRPESLRQVFRYLSTFYPGRTVVVADGSDPSHAALTKQVCGEHSNVEYRNFPAEMAFFERLHRVVGDMSDELVIMGSDDDYPIFEALDQAEAELAASPSAATAMGSTIHLTLDESSELTARFQVARRIAGPEPFKRAHTFSQWPFSTTYAVTRRSHLEERYRRARELAVPGFFDFAVGIHDCMAGQVLSLPRTGFIATRHFGHSYWRADSALDFLENSADLLAQVEVWREDLEHVGMAPGEATHHARWFIKQRLREHLGDTPQRRAGFSKSRLFNQQVVQNQFAEFKRLFDESSPDRERWSERLFFIGAALRQSAAGAGIAAPNYRSIDASHEG